MRKRQKELQPSLQNWLRALLAHTEVEVFVTKSCTKALFHLLLVIKLVWLGYFSCCMSSRFPSGGAKRLFGGPLPPLSVAAAPQCLAWASAGGYVEKAFPHCSQRGLCFMMPHSIGSHYLPWGQWQFLFHGEQWMMVASPKGNNSAWGEKQQQQNNF